MSNKAAPSEQFRAQLLEEMRVEAAFDGWNQSTLLKAAKAVGLNEGQVLMAAPEGIDSLLETWSDECDAQARAILKQADLSDLKIREKITKAVRTRIETLNLHKEAAKRASHALSAPWRAPLAAKLVWNMSDMIWDAIGDPSTDFNWYTKRMTLSAVLSDVMIVWLSETDEQRAWDRLDERIENVMQFEKIKGQARKFSDGLPNPLDVLKLVPRRPFG